MSAYDELLERLLSEQPRGGWTDVADLPELTDADLAACAKDEGALVLDAADSELFIRRVIDQLASHDPTMRRYALIGTSFVAELQSLAKAYLLRELRAEADRRAAEHADEVYHRERDERGTWADAAAEDAGVSRHAEL